MVSRCSPHCLKLVWYPEELHCDLQPAVEIRTSGISIGSRSRGQNVPIWPKMSVLLYSFAHARSGEDINAKLSPPSSPDSRSLLIRDGRKFTMESVKTGVLLVLDNLRDGS